MIKFGKAVVKHRVLIFIISLLLLIPSFIGYVKTKVNYDILSYLPSNIDTMKGQDVLVDEFNTGSLSMYMVDGMEPKDVSKLKEKIENVDHVKDVLWYDSVADISTPMEMLPDNIKKVFNSDSSTLMAIIFDDTTSAPSTLKAIEDIRKVSNEQCFLSGMSAVVTDTKNLSDEEVPIYVAIAVVLSAIILSIFMDSFIVPFIFLASIGIAIVYNMGTNIFLGQISYITKALSAVLQLGVTMDYSIFLWHSYAEQKQRFNGDKTRAMAHAISSTAKSVLGSSITTIAGFLALCFMTFTLGLDLGIVMAKGVIFGVIVCVTTLPSMILIFDKALEKTSHKAFMINMPKLSQFATNHYKLFLIIFIILIIPAFYCQKNTNVYYKLDQSLPEDLPSIVANNKLANDFDMNTTHMILLNAEDDSTEVRKMSKEIQNVDGVSAVLGLESAIGPSVPMEMVPSKLTSELKNDKHELMLVTSKYEIASDEVNAQISQINDIIKKYDSTGMIFGEAPGTKDLIDITAVDFNVVSAVSIAAVFLIILFVFKSISLPIILVCTIEFAIFINMGIPFLTHTTLPFIASVVIGTIQLGATVDYAILMTTRYGRERGLGHSKKEAIIISHQACTKSIIVSGLSFFAATFGVGLYSKIDMISSLCTLMARGAIISMIVVILILPSMYMAFDKFIMKCSIGFGKKIEAAKADTKPTEKSAS